MSVTCSVCGDAFDAKSPRAKFCSDRCRKRKSREPERVGGLFDEVAPADGMGPVEAKTRSDVAALMSGHPVGEAIAEAAYAMARLVDQYPAVATSANRELLRNLEALTGMGVDGDADLDGFLSTPVVSPEVRDTPES